MFIVVVFGYIGIAALALHLVVLPIDDKWAAFIFAGMFLLGWFFVFGVASEQENHRRLIDAIKPGIKNGWYMLKNWALGMCVMFVIAIAITFLSYVKISPE
ncbi:MAG: hypothetical protein A2051_07210 [Desulfovibrionales bacterium GWA2_65_9]|nr:MAG: hypothetical protein A2051_07210 [Desulfovibrionales bacterium GWA2_65_9]